VKKRIPFLITIVLFFAVFIVLFNVTDDKFESEEYKYELIKVNADSSEEAAFMISDKLFEDKEFEDISITDFELIDYVQINKYDNLTSIGTIYSYELAYKFKTDDERAFIDNKITGEPVETNVWIEDVIAHRFLVLFENEGTYYRLYNNDMALTISDYSTPFYFVHDSDSYNENMIIMSIFENIYDIPELELAHDATSNGLLKKLVRDIGMYVKPDYTVDETKSIVYDITFDKEIKCIYFKADLYDSNGRVIAENKGFSLFMYPGYTIGELDMIENYLPKSL